MAGSKDETGVNEEPVGDDEERGKYDSHHEQSDEGGDDDADEDIGSHVGSAHEDSSADEGEGSTHDDDDHLQEYTDEHGVTQMLSAYEIQRLERIKRNKAYLSSLGLEREKDKPKAGKTPTRDKKRNTLEPSEIRSSSRRISQTQVSYAENNFKWSEFGKTSDLKIGIPISSARKERKYKNERENRMDRGIYNEFLNIVSERKQSLKLAEKCVRRAEVELKYFIKRAAAHDRKHRKVQETTEYFNQIQEERRHLGCTVRDMLYEVDRRLPELLYAQKSFDQNFFSQDVLLQREEQRRENEKKMEMIDALDRFPRALKDANRDLSVLLLERAPADPPPPRRGGRQRKSDCPDNVPSGRSDTAAAIMMANQSLPDAASGDGTWGDLATALAAETISSSAGPISNSEIKDDDAAEQVGVKKKKKARNVGGWLSPIFSGEVDRAWVASDKFHPKFELAKYVPQVGDSVLYYPNGHRLFLDIHPDVLGKALKTKMRIPLWVRAERERRKLAKDERKKQGEDVHTDEVGNDADAEDDNGAKASPNWWNDEWLEGGKGMLGNYPLVCLVKDVQVEFPPDPNAQYKVVTDDGKGDVQIVWEVPTDAPGKNRKKSHPPLCLAVTLKALTSLLPPTTKESYDAMESRQELNPPPNFTVITFPSKAKAQPFIVPFAWGYKVSHMIKVEDKIKVLTRGDLKGTVKDFVCLNSSVGKCRFDERLGEIASFLAGLKEGSHCITKTPTITSSSKSPQSSNNLLHFLPVADMYAVIERFTSFLDSQKLTVESTSTPTKDVLSYLIRSTLPLWNGVSVLREGTVKRMLVSPWEISLGKVAAKNHENESYQEATADLVAENSLTYNIDEPLRAKIECALEDFIKSEDDSLMFFDHVTDDIAPCYSCSVPLGMCFSKVLRRLASQKVQGAIQPRCYYRTVESLLNDLTAILDNCLLYNSPDSEVADKVYHIIPAVKRVIGAIVTKHVREKESRNKADDERRKAMLASANSSAIIESPGGDAGKCKVAKHNRRSPKLYSFQGPYPEVLNRAWIEDIKRDNSWTSQEASTSDPCCDTTMNPRNWVPQSGDFILYSRSMHCKFVEAHFDSLTTDQCRVPQFTMPVGNAQDLSNGNGSVVPTTQGNLQGQDFEKLSDATNSHWLIGKILWVRTVFPRLPGKERGVKSTFAERTPVLALGITFDYQWADTRKPYILYWRPCIISSNHGISVTRGPPTNVCESCGCDDHYSFVYPAWYYKQMVATREGLFIDSPILLPTPSPSTTSCFNPPIGLQMEEITSIDRCLNMLKSRCLGNIAPDYIDPKFCMANVKAGWCPTAKMRKALPTFERLLEIDGLDDIERAASQRKTTKERKWIIKDEEASALPLLARVNFLPPLSIIPTQSNTEKQDNPLKSIVPKYEETMCPAPKLCLELIQHRLRNGYYRNRSGIMDDIQEAYVQSSLLVLTKPASKKFGQHLSVRRIAKALSASDGKPSTKRKRKEYSKSNKDSTLKADHMETAVMSTTARQNSPIQEPNSRKSPTQATKALMKTMEFSGILEEHKKAGLSNEEVTWVERIGIAKRLHATALVCVSETTQVERVFGTVPKKIQTKGKVVPSKDFLERQQRFMTARNKLGLLLAAVSRDIDYNRHKGYHGSELPVFRVKITGSSLAFPLDDKNVSDISTPFTFEPSHYVNNKELIRTLFGKPGMYESCARCQAHRRTILACRVQRSHSSPDFNWIEVFRDVGGIDELLHMLRTGQPPVVTHVSTTVVSNADNNDKDEDCEVDLSKENDEGDPDDNLEKAQRAVCLSQQVLTLAQIEASGPPKLSEAFIKSYFTVDPDDGKYTTCVVCGLIGDLMCCEEETCPTVVHPKCVGLDEAPEGDWFCVHCTSRPRQTLLEFIKPETNDVNLMTIKDSVDDGFENGSTLSGAALTLDIAPPSIPLVEKATKMNEYEELSRELLAMLDELRAKRFISKPKGNEGKVLSNDSIDLQFSILGTEESPASKPVELSTLSHDSEVIADHVANAVDCMTSIKLAKENEQEETEQGMKTRKTLQEIVVGSRITKSFDALGDFLGTVRILPTTDYPYYRVRYEDGDEEDLSETEIHDLLVLSSQRQVATQSRFAPASENGVNPRLVNITISDARRRGRTRGKKVALCELSHASPSGKGAENRAARESTNGAPIRKRGRPRKLEIDKNSTYLLGSVATPGVPSKNVDNLDVVSKTADRPLEVKKRGRPRKINANNADDIPTASTTPDLSPARKRGRTLIKD